MRLRRQKAPPLPISSTTGSPHAKQNRVPRLLQSLEGFPARRLAPDRVLLYMLARGSRARNIVEFGTSFGISTLYLAAALRDNGGDV